MTETSQQLLRDQLQEERERVREQLSRLGHGAAANSDGASLDFDENFADSGQVAAEQGETRVLAASLQDQLVDVEHALEKIDDGSYGQCETCGEDIGDARLEAMPASRYCIKHA
jgi:RNA polymerase-binding transcription factor DksA